jgi:pimeloyl-ACP methyl ester carboxylesterase
MTTTVQPDSRTIELRGLGFHYLEWPAARSGATPLVLLHGLSSSAAAWRRVAEHFADDYRVIALDQRGHGESEWADPSSYQTDDYVADLEAFVDALGLERFVLVGHSMGGHHTIAYTARHPERVIAALANDIPPALDRNPETQAQQFPNGAHPVYASIDAWMDAQRPNSPFTPEAMLRFSGESRLKAVDAGIAPKYDPNASIHWAPADLWDEARTITRPILFIRGGRSTVLDPQTLQRMDMEIEPARSITLEKSGHNTFFDMEPEFVRTLADFLGAHAT